MIQIDFNLIMPPEVVKQNKIEYLKRSCSTVLAAYVVSFRVLGFNKDLAVLCMNELVYRKNVLEDDFNYEAWIDIKEKYTLSKINVKEQDTFMKFLPNAQKLLKDFLGE